MNNVLLSGLWSFKIAVYLKFTSQQESFNEYVKGICMLEYPIV